MYAYGATMALMFAFGFLIKKFPDLTATIIRWAGSAWTGVFGPGIAVAVLAVSRRGFGAPLPASEPVTISVLSVESHWWRGRGTQTASVPFKRGERLDS